MWPQCGSDRLEERRESQTRERGGGERGKQGSAERAAEFSLQQMVFLFGLSFNLQVKEAYCWREKRVVFALHVCICTGSGFTIYGNITSFFIWYCLHNMEILCDFLLHSLLKAFPSYIVSMWIWNTLETYHKPLVIEIMLGKKKKHSLALRTVLTQRMRIGLKCYTV